LIVGESPQAAILTGDCDGERNFESLPFFGADVGSAHLEHIHKIKFGVASTWTYSKP
jgi:hypothetical protein